jgi:5-methyltetrahydrofolate--homocysteine methyltransferase
VAQVRTEYEGVRNRFLGRQKQKNWLSLAAARANCTPLHVEHQATAPVNLGITVFDAVPLTDIRDFIDWTPFFSAWELNGAYPRILNDPHKGKEAQKIFNEAQQWLDTIINEQWLTAKAVIGLFPAAATDDDSVIVYDEKRETEQLRFHFLRQQTDKKDSRANLCLSDFIAAEHDYIGGFAVGIFGAEERAKKFEAEQDDYAAIMIKVLADRLAEALAEMLHQQVRRQYWGYAADETLSDEDMIREKYQGIRPAAGYPACPEHSEKGTLWQLLDVENRIGMTITESYAMMPAAAVSGLYFANPEAHYFTVGQINKEQVTDYAKRKGWSVEEAEKWLAPVLGY